MDEREAIEQRLRRKEAEIQSLEDKLRAARTYVQALRDVLNLLSKGVGASATQPQSETVLRPGSAVALAREVILARGKPVHINELLEAQGKEASRENRASLTSSLSAYVRRGETFTRPAPNTFGLVELAQTTASQGNTPPEGFGVPPKPALSLAEELSSDDDIPF